MPYESMSPLSTVADENLERLLPASLAAEIRLLRKALRYCKAQEGDDATK